MDSVNVDAKSIKTFNEIQSAIKKLNKDEVEIAERLEWSIGNRHHLEARLTNLAHLVPTLHLIQADAKKLENTISFTHSLANTVSAKVRQLDLAKSRVSDVQRSVGDLLDLEGCAFGVSAALKDEDYEKAAAHINRFLSMDEAVLRHSANTTNKGENMDTWFERLRSAETKLKCIININFDEAVKRSDSANIERFLKLFPLVNEHKEGLTKFLAYLCIKIAEKNGKNLILAKQVKPIDKRSHIIWADTLTLLFEEIARIIEVHQPIIETYYKPGYMSLVIEILQQQCDKEASHIISDMKTARNLNAIMAAVESSSRQLTMTNTGAQRSMEGTAIPDSKNLDTLLGELTLMTARGELYLRFLKRRTAADYDVSISDVITKKKKIEKFERFLSHSQLVCDLAIVIGMYTLLEKYFLNASFKKAVAMDSLDGSQITSSVVDDSFYIMKKCVRRAIASNNVDGVCVMLNHCVDLLETRLVNIFHQNLRKGFPTQGYIDLTQAYSAALQLSLPSRKAVVGTSDSEDLRQIFLTALNNACISIQDVNNLHKSLSETIDTSFTDLSPTSIAKIHSCLDDLQQTSKKFKNIVDFGLNQLQITAVKPKLKPWVDTFTSVSHDISEDEFVAYEANDPFIEPLMVQLDGLLGSFTQVLTQENHKSLVSSIVQEVALQIEKVTFKSSFSRLGGLQFDREIRSLSAYLSRVSEWSVRDQLMRLSQMATLLNLENLSEVSEYATSSSWRLTPSETRRVLQLRIDFKYEEVQRLRL